ncbi:hypothetical protein FOA52_002986 [Chlamydomonas sp. UWO 241]|nr:hypothetical protein FOA52_002986 [Chlamydomonas sp. UWO 241]
MLRSLPSQRMATAQPSLAARCPLPSLARGPRRGVATAALDAGHAADVVASASAAAHHLPTLLASVADAAGDSLTAAAVPAATSSGPFDFLADTFENLLKAIDDSLEKAGVPNSYGFSIIALTVLVKLATFPLSQQQVKSTVAIQALQPRVKELQARYAAEPETLQVETARLYKVAGVNPLAGCLPTLATIPVFIGLYKALSNAADQGLGKEPFFWIPDLSGPTTLVDRTAGAGMKWLFPFVDGAPPIGWATAAAYLVMPVLLVASQYASMKIVQPPPTKDADGNDPQAQTQAILKFLPLMIGWFSLNVPAGLTLYWFINNILSTAQQLYLKSSTVVNVPEITAAAAGASPQTYVKPKEERVKKVTGADVGARRSKMGDVIDTEAVVMDMPAQGSRGGKGGSKGAKFAAQKAKEASKKAAALSVDPAAAPAAAPPPEPVQARKD